MACPKNVYEKSFQNKYSLGEGAVKKKKCGDLGEKYMGDGANQNVPFPPQDLKSIALSIINYCSVKFVDHIAISI